MPGQLLAVVSDGAARTPQVLATMLETDVATVTRALSELDAGGLALVRESSGALRVRMPFSVLDAERIGQSLLAQGVTCSAAVVPVIDSTNAQLLGAVRDGSQVEYPYLLTAELQNAGRGRQGRSWHTAAGSSLAVSVLCKIPRGLAGLSGLSLVVGLAVRAALSRLVPNILLKWPNDLLCEGKKLGGILVEVHPLGDFETAAVVGIGINVREDSERSVSLSKAGPGALQVTDLVSAGAAEPVDRNALVVDLAQSVLQHLGRFGEGGFASFVGPWNEVHAFQGLNVQVFERGVSMCSGVARGVDDHGRLCIDTPDGPRALVAGDLTLRAT